MYKTFYSILSVVIRTEIDERLSIGLLTFNGDVPSFLYSKNKLEAVKQLLPLKQYNYLKNVLDRLHKGLSSDYNKTSDLLHKSNIINSEYVNYLYRYSNNLLAVSRLQAIDMPYSNELIHTLYTKYIDSSEKKEKKDEKYIKTVRKQFLNKVKIYFNIEPELTNKQIPELIFPVKIDLIGENNFPVFAQFIDAERNLHYIKADIVNVQTLKDVLANSKSFIISKEPDKSKNPAFYENWKYLKDGNFAEYIDISEIEKLHEYAKNSHIVPFLQD